MQEPAPQSPDPRGMSPLQKIAMGLLIVLAPGYFRIGGHPYDVLADPIGWLMVISGMRVLRGRLDVDLAYWLAWVALVVSTVFWFPQVTDLLPRVRTPIKGVDPSVEWFISLPQAAFSLLLVKAISQAGIEQQPRDVFVAGRFGVLSWAFIAAIALPPVAFGAQVDSLIVPTLVGIAVVNLALIYQLFRVHRREYLAGPGPLLIAPAKRPGNDEGRPPSQ